MANFICDLHSHSTLSDGNDTVEELIDAAVREGVKILALTDHDVIPPKDIVIGGNRTDLVDYARSRGLLLIPGIEFSAQTYIEDTHLVCLGCDYTSVKLKELEDEIKQSKIDSYKRLLKKLTDNGMPITYEELLGSKEGLTPDTLQKKLIFDIMAKKGYAPSWKDAKIMLKTRRELSVEREKPDAIRVIKAVHEAGGIIIQAHPYLVAPVVPYEGREITRAEFTEILIENGLDGIEKIYPYRKTSSLEKRPDDVLYDEVETLYAHRLLISGGSDYHDDAKKGTPDPRTVGECGVEEKNINKILRRVFKDEYYDYRDHIAK